MKITLYTNDMTVSAGEHGKFRIEIETNYEQLLNSIPEDVILQYIDKDEEETPLKPDDTLKTLFQEMGEIVKRGL